MNVHPDTGEVLTGEVLDEGERGRRGPPDAASPSSSTDLVPAGPMNLIGVTEPGAYLEAIKVMADQLVAIVNQQKLYTVIQGRKVPTVQAWTYLGSMMGVFAAGVGEPEPITDRNGSPGWKATAEARTLAGALVGRATAICTIGEKNWSDDRKQGPADDHDLLAMAQTRAVRNALKGPLGFIVHVAGFEIPDDSPRSPEQNARFHALLSELEAAEPVPEGETSHRDSIKAWGHEQGWSKSTKDWTAGQMTEAMDELERRIEVAKVPF